MIFLQRKFWVRFNKFRLLRVFILDLLDVLNYAWNVAEKVAVCCPNEFVIAFSGTVNVLDGRNDFDIYIKLRG
jgi:hypothetical protein